MFDLDTYLARIAMATRPTPDATGLTAVHRAQRLAIPFENLDIRLGRGIRIDSDSVFAKLVIAKRGGYCFELNRLFADALAALGFAARPLLARVWLDAVGTPPLTHTLVLVAVDGKDWIADAGFGGSDDPPMRLIADVEVVGPGGAAFRLIEDARGWVMQRRAPAQDWVDQYSFTLAEVADVDLAMSNHWTSTMPGTTFVDQVVARVVLPTGVASLTDCRYRRAVGNDQTLATITDPRVYRMRLGLLFGIALTAEEVGALGLFGE